MDPITIGLIAGGVSSAAGIGGSFLSNYFNKKNAKDQSALNYKYALRMAQNGPSASVQGLRKAGLNPILAATDGAFSTPSMPSTDIKSSDFSQIGKGISDGLVAFQIANQAKTTESNIELNKASALKEFTHALNQMRTGGLTGHYAALHSLGVSLGFKSDEISGILRNYGFSPLSQSTPDSPKTTPAEVKSRNAPDDGKSSVEISSHGPYDSKPYTGSRTGSWRAEMNRKRKENLKYNNMMKRRRYERWNDYDKSFDRMPNVRRSIYR